MQIMQGAHIKYFHVQTHVQIARESLDLNMDFVHLIMGVNSYTNRNLCKNAAFHQGMHCLLRSKTTFWDRNS